MKQLLLKTITSNELLASHWRFKALEARHESLKYCKRVKTVDLTKYYALQRKASEYMAYVHWLTSKIDHRGLR